MFKNFRVMNIFVSLSGGAAGALLYFLIYNIRTAAAGGYKLNYIFLFLLAAGFSVFFSVIRARSSVYFSEMSGEDINKSFQKNGIMLCVPLLLIFFLPLYFFFHEKLGQLTFDILGNVYIPFAGYVRLGMQGYVIAAAMGFITVTISFLFMARFLILFYDNHVKFGYGAKLRMIFVSFFVFYAVATSYVTFSYPPTGDEPHYLLISQSIAGDMDINLKDEYAGSGEYGKFYPGILEQESVHNTTGVKENAVYPLHSIGLPVIITPVYKFWGRYGVQLVMNLFTALLAALLYAILRNNFFPENISLLTVFSVFLTVPLAINSSLVLTEIPSALIVLYCIFVLYNFSAGKNKILFFTGIAVLPWIHAKLAVFSAVFYIVYYVYAAVKKNFSLKKEAVYNVPVIISGVLFVAFYSGIYGKFAPFALVSVYVSDSFYFVFSAVHAVKNFLTIFFDRNYGLFIYNPLYVVFVWGAALAVLKKSGKMLIPMALTVPYFLLYIAWSDAGGSMTPARQMIPVLPVWVFYMAYFMKETSFNETKLFKWAAFVSVFISYLLMVFPFLRYASSKHKIYPLFEKFNIPRLIPPFAGKSSFSYLIIILYIIIIIILFLKYSGYKGRTAITEKK